MTTRNLDALFHPQAIALVGASDTPGSVGRVIAHNLLNAGFAGPVLPVNPHAASVGSSLAYPNIAALPRPVDLAVIATPAPTVPGIVAELGAAGCRAAVVISAGVTPGLKQQMLDASRPHLLRLVGPNCLGFISPRVGINASFAHLTPAPGGLALVAQSGAICAAALDWAQPRGIGFSHVISIGDAADVDFGDLLDYLALDPDTKGILVYLESIGDARKFMTAGRIAARAKPVVVIKAGRTAAGAAAAFSHTGALAGSDAVYDAAFRRAGMLRVGGLRELFDAVTTLSAGLRVHGDRLAVLTNGGGAGVMAVDALAERGGRLATLKPETVAAIDKLAPHGWSNANPVDILGDARPGFYGHALEALLADKDNDAILVMNCPTAVASSADAAEAVVAVAPKGPFGRPVLTCWLGDQAAGEGRRIFAAAGIPTHETPDEAVRAFMHLVDHRRNQELLMQTPADRRPLAQHAEAARVVVDAALAEGRLVLTDPEARAVLKAYGLPVVEDRTARNPAEAAAAAREIGGVVALKILSPDISHKTDVGGVALGLDGPADVLEAAEGMIARVQAARPDARIEGFVVQPMVARPHAHELLCGVTRDPTFGPVVLFGHGGVATEVLADRSIGLPPLNDVLARDMIRRTQVAKLLSGFRDRPAADLPAIADVLVTLGEMASGVPEIAELDINPLLADDRGVLCLDARIRLRAPGQAAARPAILPYPRALERDITFEDGGALHVRPIRPEDAPRIEDLIDRSTPEDVRLRFASGFRHLPPGWAARLSQIDYDREMALVAENADGEILGVSRLVGDPEGETAEFALMVRSDRQHRGLGGLLLRAVLDHAKARGIKEVWGDVARHNDRMLELAENLGFGRRTGDDVARVKVVKRLDLAPEPAE
ncbi:bifunctional acetate--CoA ligase family protein/GNAT family N-acetyltransferase [Phenylobacterium sp. J367]|uniref:bifunctional acetate--CoA ligase family protein/GNAT family N-acetyltransferase n=1 Tax=Phenylobacterium sp. J367 TaxID=2898435 RepID=UPI0021518502|nr:bifunctional acetate--CoA ligase family protein/GNAT family N-acetyltransferase [Phenylobacterium sp. J367]MCR5881060.1 bifunctional acetate--CoA ligase family protein/GNAT family N-acetyltransferase [Phenylobacterium sp. J367]